MTAKVNPIPEGMHSVTPHLVVDGAADAIEFYKKAFNAVETARIPGKEGKLIHAAVRIGDSTVMLVDEFPDFGSVGPKALKGTPVTLHIYVPDIDATYAQALAAGAAEKMPPADMFWGDRYAQVTDPFGHVWSIATHTRDMTREEMDAAMKQQMPDCG
ncbi:VOC family protein [Rugamonas sp. A1-17]|nr:VOC family protein [Rugamonas sp. A1-17]